MSMGKILVYQLYPHAWGSIKAMTLFLPRIKALGADYVWVSHINQSSRQNQSYNISDCMIDDRLGSTADFDEFTRTAHAMGLKVLVELNLTEYPAWQFDNSDICYSVVRASTNWFSGGVLNRSLVGYFKSAMSYWMRHGVDGFRLEQTQFLNANPSQQEVKIEDIFTGGNAVTVINELSNLYGGASPFMMLDLYDLNGEVIDYYAKETDAEFLIPSLLKVEIAKNTRFNKIKEKIRLYKNPKFMLELENHDSPRITSKLGIDGEEVMDLMFASEANAISIYQGQELGLENPARLSLAQIFNLDARAAIQIEHSGEDIDIEEIKHDSCANTRLPLPLNEYTRQEEDKNSVLNYTKDIIKVWKNS